MPLILRDLCLFIQIRHRRGARRRNARGCSDNRVGLFNLEGGHSLVMLKTTCLERSKSAVSLGLIKLNHLQESPLIGAESDLQSMR
jgi:hypothetical protein